MESSLFELLARSSAAGSAAIALVLLLRRQIRTIFGARLAYQSWAIVPVVLVAAALPSMHVQHTTALAFMPTLQAASDSVQIEAAAGMTLGAWLIALWAAGAAASGLNMIGAHLHFLRRLGALAQQGGVHFASGATEGPALLGLFRPRIVVPADFAARYDAGEQALIIAHETRHAQRGDPFANALIALAQCAFWFNPLVHIAAPRCRFDQELACDADVMQRHPGMAQAYAAAMLKTQFGSTPVLTTCHWQSSHPLKERIMQLKRTSPTSGRRRAGRIVLAALACSGMLAIVAARAESAATPSYTVAFTLTHEGETSTPSVMVAEGEQFAMRGENKGKSWAGEFLVTRDKKGIVWLKSQFTLDGKQGGIHNGGLRPGEKVHLSIRSDDGQWRELLAMDASVTPVGNAGKR